jgi:hypothetical protein
LQHILYFSRPTLFEFKTSDGTIAIPNPIDGKIIMMPRIIDVKEYNYIGDVQLTFQNGTVKTILTSYWKIINDVSR